MIIGVLALQGAFREHIAAFARVGVNAREVRTPEELAEVDALVIPGGESTTMRMGLAKAGLREPLAARIATGMPAWGTCAGLVVLGSCEPDVAPPPLGVLDVHVSRNGFGRQVASFETSVDIVADGRSSTVHGVFIRAPRIERIGPSVETIGTINRDGDVAEPVVVRQGSLLGCSFHPELTADDTLHEHFAGMVRAAAHRAPGLEEELHGRPQ